MVTESTSYLAREQQLDELIAAYLDQVEAGGTPNQDEWLDRHPDFKSELTAFFTDRFRLERLAAPLRAIAHPVVGIDSPGRLGDFRLVREIGRGGMGVVYEAEQISLGRRVALKVLPFAAMLDKQQLSRFKNEARAAATLDHPNIVAIYSVGVERSVHFYAMQLIEGQSLAQVVEQLRTSHLPLPPGEGRGEGQVGAASRAALPDYTDLSDSSPARLAGPTADTAPVAALSTLPDFDSREYFRTIAQLGIQAAEALDHAHQNGILHRDIKPANLLVDDTSKLWITDFGLARIEQDAGMTMTGDILGTLRYMSPEQALAKRVVVDHRSDIYSLGVTFYEMLTLQPAYTGNDRHELLRQIAFDDPRAPRQINSRIPLDLETIILKAIEKNPGDRYATAKEFADDLRRYVEVKPIKAKSQTLLATMRKWSRRHRGLLVATAATLLVSGLVLAGSIGWIARDRAARQSLAEATANGVLEEATRLVEQEKWPEALMEVSRTEDVLTSSGLRVASTARAHNLRNDIEMVLRLEEIRSGPETERVRGRSGRFDPDTNRKNAEAFRDYGIDVESLSPIAAAERIAQCGIRLELATALDSWAQWRRSFIANDEGWKRLVEIARLADPDRWRNRLRDALGKDLNDRRAALTELAVSINAEPLPPPTLLLLANLLRESDADVQAVAPLLVARRRHPDNYWINLRLGSIYLRLSPPQLNEALLYCTVAQALRPESAVAHNNLGIALRDNGLLDEAITSFQDAIRLQPTSGEAHANLGMMLRNKGLTSEALVHLQTGNQLMHDDLLSCFILAELLATSRDDEVRDGKRAVELATKACERTKYEDAEMIDILAEAYAEVNDFESAVKWSSKAIELTNNDEHRELFAKHLEAFQAGRPWRTEGW